MGTFFNIGFAAAVPAGANPTPMPFALLTGFNINVKPEYATFDGQYLAPKVVALKGTKYSGKIEGINIFAGALAQNFGLTPSVGSQIPVINEIKLNLTGATYTVVNGAAGITDYWVQDLTSGIQMTRVASAPAVGQYVVVPATGVYTFNAADNGHNLSFTHTYTSASVGKSVDILNVPGSIVTGVQLVGVAPPNNGKPCGVKLWNAYFDDYSLDFKSDDFTKKSVSFFGAEDPTTGKILTQWTGE